MIPIPSQIIATEPLPKETLDQTKVVIGQEFTGKSRIDIKSIRATELVAHWIASDP